MKRKNIEYRTSNVEYRMIFISEFILKRGSFRPVPFDNPG